MTPEHTAITEPHLWTQVAEAHRWITVRHPNGVLLNAFQADVDWHLYLHPQLTTPRTLLGEIPRESQGTDFASLVQDTLQAAGPEARAQLDAVRAEITWWAVSHRLPAAQVRLLRQRGSAVFTSAKTGQITVWALPDDLHARLRAFGSVLVENDITVDLPTSAHATLGLRAQMAARRPTPD